MKKYILASLAVITLASPAFAKGVAAPAGDGCMKETVTVNVSYNNLKGQNFEEIKKSIDGQNAKIDEYAKQQKIANFSLQSKSYNIYANPASYNADNSPSAFQYSGSFNSSYKLVNAYIAFKFCNFPDYSYWNS